MTTFLSALTSTSFAFLALSFWPECFCREQLETEVHKLALRELRQHGHHQMHCMGMQISGELTFNFKGAGQCLFSPKCFCIISSLEAVSSFSLQTRPRSDRTLFFFFCSEMHLFKIVMCPRQLMFLWSALSRKASDIICVFFHCPIE